MSRAGNNKTRLTSLLLFFPDFLFSCWFCLCLAHESTLKNEKGRKMQQQNARARKKEKKQIHEEEGSAGSGTTCAPHSTHPRAT